MDTLHIEAADFAALAAELLGAGRAIRFSARGSSMSPFIRDGDIVTVRPARAADLRPGSVALFVRPDGEVMLHRVLGLDQRANPPVIIARGDARTGPCDTFVPDGLLGQAASARRGARTIRLDPPLARWLGLLWARTQPLGATLMAAARGMRRIGCRQRPLQ